MGSQRGVRQGVSTVTASKNMALLLCGHEPKPY